MKSSQLNYRSSRVTRLIRFQFRAYRLSRQAKCLTDDAPYFTAILDGLFRVRFGGVVTGITVNHSEFVQRIEFRLQRQPTRLDRQDQFQQRGKS